VLLKRDSTATYDNSVFPLKWEFQEIPKIYKRLPSVELQAWVQASLWPKQAVDDLSNMENNQKFSLNK
jgi:hypothetical protein